MFFPPKNWLFKLPVMEIIRFQVFQMKQQLFMNTLALQMVESLYLKLVLDWLHIYHLIGILQIVIIISYCRTSSIVVIFLDWADHLFLYRVAKKKGDLKIDFISFFRVETNLLDIQNS